MATYAIGDIQGCYSSFLKLLDLIQFDASKDKLWFTGDLVNRGPQSLETLRFIKKLGKNQQIVLGNHDLHLLAVAYGKHSGSPDDTLQSILAAPDREELINWLLQQPLLHYDSDLNYLLVHAGLSSLWDLATAIQLAKEVEHVLQSDQAPQFFENMYGNEPNQWSPDLQGWERLRCITNFFTRVRFCHPDGSLELKAKGKVEHTQDLIPWFQIPHRENKDLKIIFGHWAALGGLTHTPNAIALDTGCIWGFNLTAMRLEDEKRFSVGCS